MKRVLAVYEDARRSSLANSADRKRVFIAVTKLPDAVVDKQLEQRTETHRTRSRSARRSADSILAAGLRFRRRGVIKADVNVKATVDALIDDRVPADPLTAATDARPALPCEGVRSARRLASHRSPVFGAHVLCPHDDRRRRVATPRQPKARA